LSIIEGFLPNKFLPIALIEKIFSLEFKSFVNFPRFEIWNKSIDLIFQKPFLGWGASTFAIIYVLEGGIYSPQHTHNIILELAYNFGIPLAFLVSSTVISIFIKSFNMIKRLDKSSSEYSIYTTFFASFSVFLTAHMTDVTYYDGRISLIFAVLLAGFLNFIEEKNNLKIVK
jgi:O-antigen ligase